MINRQLVCRCVVTALGLLIAGTAWARVPPDDRPDTDELRGKLRHEVTARDDFGPKVADELLEKYAGQPVVPRLIDLAKDETGETAGRERALDWLGWTHDHEAENFLLDYAKELANPGGPKWQLKERLLFSAAMVGLGFCDSAKATDYLFEAMRQEYWKARANLVSPTEIESVRNDLVIAVAVAGGERAEKARQTGEDVPEDLKSRLRNPDVRKLAQKWKEFREAHHWPNPEAEKAPAPPSVQPKSP